jgi:hypothetical protein
MSIKAEITRKVMMDSHYDFYRFIKNQEDLLNRYIEFKIFNDHVFLSKNGCPCDVEENEKVSIDIYKQFNKMDQSAFDEIKKIMKCSNIIFKLNNEFIFEL